jgi:hypothetical protein
MHFGCQYEKSGQNLALLAIFARSSYAALDAAQVTTAA